MKGARSILISFTASIMLGFGIPSIATAAATTWTVTSYGDDPDDASTLRGALHAAHDGDTIDLTSLTGAIVLTYGAAQVLRELPINASITIRGPGPDKLAIDGNKFSTVFHVFGVTVTISGLTIRNGVGTVDGAVGLGFGGGIRNSGALTLTDCTISGNSADGGGAAIFNLPGKTVAIDNCTLSNNTAVAIGEYDTVGGAIWNSSNDLSDPSLRVSGTVTVTNSTIANNSANGGAGIYNEGTLVVSDTTVSGNTATAGFEDLGVGGGIINDLFGSVTLTNVTVSNNSAEGLYGYGGGLVTSNVATVTGSTFSGNSPEAINNDTTLTLTNSTIWGNKRDGLVSLGFAPGNGYGYPQSSVTLVN
ncbi:MAG TPA: right-handed parallel beta-helix repeat-containing protein, partial [Gemmatimonadaceae bacterium]